MMSGMPLTCHPPQRVIVKPEAVPLSGATVEWHCKIEYSVFVTYIENTMRYNPLEFISSIPSWSGDNRFGLRTGTNNFTGTANLQYDYHDPAYRGQQSNLTTDAPLQVDTSEMPYGYRNTNTHSYIASSSREM